MHIRLIFKANLKMKQNNIFPNLKYIFIAGSLILASCTSESDTAQVTSGDAQFASEYATSQEYNQPVLQPPNGEPYNDTFFENYGVNPRIDTEDDFQSTFALDVDTGAYTLGRGWINDGNKPSKDSVRVEEYVNYFDTGYASPTNKPFSIFADGGPTPFMENNNYQLIRVAVQSTQIDDSERPDSNLTFVVDVSGSMSQELPKVRSAMSKMMNELRPTDRVSIVTYGSDVEVLLPSTPISEPKNILNALNQLESNGSTNAEAGLRLGYKEASKNFQKDKINRVILLSDGVANVGATGADAILETIRDASVDGIDLVTVGFGRGNYNDVMMEQLANDGNGFYAFVDSEAEAKKLFSEDLTGTLLTVAKDAKIQVEFDEKSVERYRLIGFENRSIADEDFRDDTVDAGEIGSGHTVTALYEVKLAEGVSDDTVLAKINLRWEDPTSGKVSETNKLIKNSDLADTYEETLPHFQLASTVSAYAELLRESYFATENNVITYDQLSAEANRLADSSLRSDTNVVEFAELVDRVSSFE